MFKNTNHFIIILTIARRVVVAPIKLSGLAAQSTKKLKVQRRVGFRPVVFPPEMIFFLFAKKTQIINENEEVRTHSPRTLKCKTRERGMRAEEKKK